MCELGLRLAASVATSCDIERVWIPFALAKCFQPLLSFQIFSRCGYIGGKYRQRLGPVKLAKLAFLATALRGEDSDNEDDL